VLLVSGMEARRMASYNDRRIARK